MHVLLDRLVKTDKQTLGHLIFDEGGVRVEDYWTLELPWEDNQNSISCIKEGTYPLELRQSSTFGLTPHLLDTPGRSLILIHVGNYLSNTRGCILPGTKFYDLDGDGLLDVANSGTAMRGIRKVMRNWYGKETGTRHGWQSGRICDIEVRRKRQTLDTLLIELPDPINIRDLATELA